MVRLLTGCIFVPVAILFAVLATTKPLPRADLVVASDELRTIDPHRVSYMDEIQVAAALFEGLTRLDPLTQTPVAAMAERWETSPDNTVFTFHLREAARWSNGDPVTAADFRTGCLRVLDPALGAQYATLLFVLRGAEAYYRSRLDGEPENDLPAETVGVVAPDARTVQFTLAAPCSYFLDLTSFPTFAPIHPALLGRDATDARAAARATGAGAWSRPAELRTNGPFTLQRWEFKRGLLLVRNAHYWDHTATNLASIEVFMVGDPNAALIGYETGRIDLVSDVDPIVARGLKAAAAAGRRPDFHIGERFATFFFRVNCRRPPLDNPDLRGALALALDRESLCDELLGLGETPAYTLVPRPTIPLMPRLTPAGETALYAPPDGLGAGQSPAARLAEARARLERSGYDRQSAARPLEIRYATNSGLQQRMCEAVQAQWQRGLGIRVELRAEERTVLGGKIRNLDYDIARSDWYGDYLDPGAFLDNFTSTSGQNRTGWANAEYDSLIAAAAREADNARRYALLAEAERILCEIELPIIPVYFRTGNHLLRPTFGGVNSNVRDLLPIHRIRRLDAATGPMVK